MTVPPKRPRDQRPIPNEERILHAFEQQVRNLLALDRHVSLVLDAIENRQSALTTDLRQQMSLCDHASLLDSVIRLRERLLESKS